MKSNSIERLANWYESVDSWEEWEVVKERALKEWREEMELAYKAGVENGKSNTPELMRRLEEVYKGLKSDMGEPLSAEEWFDKQWK